MDAMPDTENRALQDKFMLRLPEGMRDRIRRAAVANNRSMNAEIVATLEARFPAPPLWDDKLLQVAELYGFDPSNLTIADVRKLRAALNDALEVMTSEASSPPLGEKMARRQEKRRSGDPR